MNDLRPAAQQALEALEAMQSYAAAERKGLRICDEAIASLRAALAQQAEQRPMHPELRKMWEDHFDKCFRAIPVPEQAEPVEPVAWLIDYEDGEREVRFVAGTRGIQRTPLYTAPPQREQAEPVQKPVNAAIKAVEEGK